MGRVRTRRGRELSKRDVDDLAREAEKGYDLTKAKRRRVRRGRPSLDKGSLLESATASRPSLYARAK